MRHEGKEEFMASLIYSMTAPKTGEKFAQSFFNQKDMTNMKLVGSYYTGQFSRNNTLFETLLNSGSAGKRIAPMIASTIERIIGSDVMSKATYDLRSLVGEASRMYYISNESGFVSYMGRLKRQNPVLYNESEIEDPRSLMIYSGSPQSGTTFAQRLDKLKVEANRVIGLLDVNGRSIKPVLKSSEPVKTKISKSVEELVNKARAVKSHR